MRVLPCLASLALLGLASGSAARERDPLSVVLDDSELVITARELVYEQERDVYEATGDVRLEQPDGRVLTADWMTFNATSRIGIASGDVTIREGTDLLRAGFAAVDLRSLTALAVSATLDTPDPGFAVEGERIERTGVNTYRIENGTFTTCRCPPGRRQRPWEIDAEEASVQVGGYAVARDIRLRMLGVPVVWLPWLAFPVKTERQTGFLIPELERSGRGGTGATAPFFWAAGDRLNVLLRPTFYSKRGLQTGLRYEAVFGEVGVSQGGASILPGDNEIDRRDPDTPFSDNRWAYWVKHDQPLAEGTRVGLDVTQLSDNQWVVDFEDLGQEARRQRLLESSGWATRARGSWTADVEMSQFDDLQNPEDVDRDRFFLHRLPDVRGTALPRRLPRLPVRVALDGRYTHFYQRADQAQVSGIAPVAEQFFDTGVDGLFDAQERNVAGFFDGADNHADNGTFERDGLFQEGELLADSGQRMDFYPRASLPLRVGIFETLSEVGFRETLYFPDRASGERREVWTARVDARTRFEKVFSLRGAPFRHVVEPRAAVVALSAPGQGANPLFVPEPFRRRERTIQADPRVLTRNSSDRIEDERLVLAGVHNRLFAPATVPGDPARLLGELGVGTGYDLERDRVTDLFAEAALRPGRDVVLGAQVGWDLDGGEIDEARAEVGWTSGRGDELALGYRFQRELARFFEDFRTSDDVFEEFDSKFDRVSQLVVSGRVILTPTWSVLASGYYSLDASARSGQVGLTYTSSCRCWEVTGLIEQRDRPDDTRVSLQVRVAGFGLGDPGRQRP